ncbi:hypothetical protein BDF19DRAFT_383299, partial [Syncephalis fuscata]
LLPSVESVERRHLFVTKLQRIFNTEWPNRGANVQLFGSTLSNLATSYSDVDICLMSPWSGFKNVYTMADGLRKYGMRNVSCVPGAKVPIVKLWDPEFKLACDINVNNPLSVQNTRMVRAYVSIDPRVRPLTMIIKHWTKRRELNDAGNQTLYSLCLYSYALQFNYNQHVICVRLGKCLNKTEKGWHMGRHERLLCVEEPFTQHRNLGNSADDVSVNGIRDEFRRALMILHQRADLSSMSKRFVFTSPTTDNNEADQLSKVNHISTTASTTASTSTSIICSPWIESNDETSNDHASCTKMVR